MKSDPTLPTDNPMPLRRALGRVKGLFVSHIRQALSAWTYRGWLPSKLSKQLITSFWKNNAQGIHKRWGHERTDYSILADIITRYHIHSVLDAGCGSRRLFELYERCGVTRVMGTDVSETALQLAHAASSRAELRLVRLEGLNEPAGSFDLCVCNRVLQHIPERDIARVVANLCRACCTIYANELTGTDAVEQVFFMKMYDYRLLFRNAGLDCLESGSIGNQTYFVFGRRVSTVDGLSDNA